MGNITLEMTGRSECNQPGPAQRNRSRWPLDGSAGLLRRRFCDAAGPGGGILLPGYQQHHQHNRPLADGLYPFTISSYPAGFFDYWAAKGVVNSATGWQGLMWPIINGDAPFFYLKVEGTTYTLLDGLQYAMGNTTAPLRVDGTYLLGDYSFSGEVEDQRLQRYVGCEYRLCRAFGCDRRPTAVFRGPERLDRPLRQLCRRIRRCWILQLITII